MVSSKVECKGKMVLVVTLIYRVAREGFPGTVTFG